MKEIEEKNNFLNINDYKNILASIQDILLKYNDIDSMLIAFDVVYDSILNLADYCSVWTFLVEPCSGKLKFFSHMGLPPDVVNAEKTINFKNCMGNYACKTGQPVAILRADHCLRLPSKILVEGVGWISHIAIPIKDAKKVLGILNVGTLNERNFKIDEIQVLVLYATILCNFIKAKDTKATLERVVNLKEEIDIINVFQNLVDGLLVMEKDFRITILNSNEGSFLDKYTEFEKGVFFEKLGDLQEDLIMPIFDGTTEIVEKEIQLVEPGDRSIKIVATPLRDSHETVEKVLLILNDITKDKRNERKRALETRISDLEKFINSLTHELNNPLTAVSGYLQMLKKKVEHNNEILKILNKLGSELHRANMIIEKMISIARVKTCVKYKVDICELVREVCRKFKENIEEDENIKILIQDDVKLPKMMLEVDNIKDALLNLLEIVSWDWDVGRKVKKIEVAIQKMRHSIQIVVSGGKTDKSRIINEMGHSPLRDMEIVLSLTQAVIQKHGGVIYMETNDANDKVFIVELPLRIEDET